MVGCGVLTTVTMNMQLGPVPTWTLTGVEPMGKNDPEAGLDVTEPEQVEPAISASGKVTVAPPCALVPTVMLLGQVIVQPGGLELAVVAVAGLELLLGN